MIRVEETLIRQASDVIRWLDATGRVGQENPVSNPLHVVLAADIGVPGLSLLHKPGSSVVWRSQRADAERLVRTVAPGRASEAQMQRPAESPYLLKGTVSDPSGIYNPRAFSKNCGNNSYPQIALYRSVPATRLSQNKSLQGVLRFQQQVGETQPIPASWAVVSLQVNLSSTGDSFSFNAQADSSGYFQIPLNRLAVAMLDSGFSAAFSVKADKSQSGSLFPDPDLMADVQVAIAGSGVFADTSNVIAEQKNHGLKLGFVAGETQVSTLELKSP
jgi:hypothetical protein